MPRESTNRGLLTPSQTAILEGLTLGSSGKRNLPRKQAEAKAKALRDLRSDAKAKARRALEDLDLLFNKLDAAWVQDVLLDAPDGHGYTHLERLLVHVCNKAGWADLDQAGWAAARARGGFYFLRLANALQNGLHDVRSQTNPVIDVRLAGAGPAFEGLGPAVEKPWKPGDDPPRRGYDTKQKWARRPGRAP